MTGKETTDANAQMQKAGADQPRKEEFNAGHRQRLRKRFLHDSAYMEDYEILELLLGYALPRRDTRKLAKGLLKHFGGLEGVASAPPQELEKIQGIGPGVVFFFRLLREFQARRAESPVRQRECLCTPQAVMDFARCRLEGCPHEEVWIATVDTGNRLINWERLHRGTVNASPFYPRDILEMALRNKATGFFLVHNHPGGSAQASRLDVEATRHLEYLSKNLGIRFMDHIIVTESSCCSLRQDGLMGSS